MLVLSVDSRDEFRVWRWEANLLDRVYGGMRREPILSNPLTWLDWLRPLYAPARHEVHNRIDYEIGLTLDRTFFPDPAFLNTSLTFTKGALPNLSAQNVAVRGEAAE